VAGRKNGTRRGPVRATRPVYLRLPLPLTDALRDAAQQRGWTINRYVETLLEQTLLKKRSL
jgi:hypothetical protein